MNKPINTQLIFFSFLYCAFKYFINIYIYSFIFDRRSSLNFCCFFYCQRSLKFWSVTLRLRCRKGSYRIQCSSSVRFTCWAHQLSADAIFACINCVPSWRAPIAAHAPASWSPPSGLGMPVRCRYWWWSCRTGGPNVPPCHEPLQ